ncbi:asparagine synthase (glutamine-hydrolyzing) [Gemmatirosa kalamazoonensis]|uniref:asparagine synthase (glutamine-hydrolyzing) n=1 Tax=Gemmatirosa kalamazoonensis TaxID=861299 RepID=W0RJT3_9BACT|nr:asparagine synthase (glutamine-hydrolyzing) [Gemmatirosa kalamazoonensis]
MCGIAGFWTTMRPPVPAAELLAGMTGAIRHRGPDDEGAWWDDASGVGLGHRRLSIIDLSAAGHQPMASRSGRYELIFNGEIYNFRELRAELERAGDAFRGHSDTEVMLAGFERWGLVPTLKRLAGMFAMALWDREERTLHLIRDRIGEKPLYYGTAGGTLLFGSELKALRAYPGWSGDIDRSAIALLMRHGYIPAPYTVFSNVRKAVPGTVLSFRSALGEPTTTRYWNAREVAESGTRDPLRLGEEELIEACERRLSETIGEEMVSDVPLGAFLSGGFDSSLIVALMQKQSARPVRTFTIGFEEKEYDEAEHARAVARHLGTDHTELRVGPSDTLAVIPKLPALYDEPFADPSQIPTFLVAQLARRHVTVSLSGDGGDEFFGGYNRYFWSMRLWRRLKHLPVPLRRGVAKGIQAVSPGGWDRAFDAINATLPASRRMKIAGDRVHKLAGVLDVGTNEQMYREFLTTWRDPSGLALGAPEHPTVLSDRDRWPSFDDFVSRMMYVDSVSYLPDDIMVKVDRATMGVSLESRAPFLDHRVVEFAWRVPIEYKVRDGQGKWLLRQVLYRHVPRALVDRPKMGFGIPISHWLRDELHDWAADLLSPERLRAQGYLDPDAVQTKWNEHQSGRRNWQYQLWVVLMFEAWLDSARA